MSVRLLDMVIFSFNAFAHQTDRSQDKDVLQECSGQPATVTHVEHIESPKGDMCRIRLDDGADLWVWSSELTPITGIESIEHKEVSQAQHVITAVNEQLSLF